MVGWLLGPIWRFRPIVLRKSWLLLLLSELLVPFGCFSRLTSSQVIGDQAAACLRDSRNVLWWNAHFPTRQPLIPAQQQRLCFCEFMFVGQNAAEQALSPVTLPIVGKFFLGKSDRLASR